MDRLAKTLRYLRTQRLVLSLGGWPPLASHVLALVLGMTTANLLAPPPKPCSVRTLRAGFVLWRPHARNLRLPAALTRGASLVMSPRDRDCRLSDSWHVAQTEPPLVLGKLSAARSLANHLQRARGKRPFRAIAGRTNVPPCAFGPRVFYGARP